MQTVTATNKKFENKQKNYNHTFLETEVVRTKRIPSAKKNSFNGSIFCGENMFTLGVLITR